MEGVSYSTQETRRIGATIATYLKPGDIVGFTGELGTGKTFLIGVICRALGVTEIITSPTFTLMNFYAGRESILHLDCYRISSVHEAQKMGFEEYFDSHYICLIEWAERIAPLLPDTMIQVNLEHVPGDPGWRKYSIHGL